MLFLNNLNHGAWYQDIEVNHVELCEISGFRAYPGELVTRWDGRKVLPWFNDPEPVNERERLRSHPPKPPIRYEPVGDELFITTSVSAEDY
jgi:hypothetical protein